MENVVAWIKFIDGKGDEDFKNENRTTTVYESLFKISTSLQLRYEQVRETKHSQEQAQAAILITDAHRRINAVLTTYDKLLTAVNGPKKLKDAQLDRFLHQIIISAYDNFKIQARGTDFIRIDIPKLLNITESPHLSELK